MLRIPQIKAAVRAIAAVPSTACVSVIKSFSRTNIVVNEPGYIYVEFRTAIMRYTDDVEFLFDESAKYIHFRSASRLGMSDMGLNRHRMEQIREKWLLLH